MEETKKLIQGRGPRAEGRGLRSKGVYLLFLGPVVPWPYIEDPTLGSERLPLGRCGKMPRINLPRVQCRMGPASGNRIAFFFATSGHSGVDRVVKNLVPGIVAAGYSVDLLKIRNHGPELTTDTQGMRVIEFTTSHVYTALPALVGYLRREHPRVLLSDKDRVNRTAIIARALSGADTRVAVRLGTTVSVNLAQRGRFERWLQRKSMRHLYPRADALLMPSAGAADDFARYIGFPRDAIRITPSPVVTPSLQALADEPPQHPWLRQKNIPVILGVGELSGRKDFTTLLHAFAILHSRRPCRLIIYGRGKQKAALLQLAGKLGVADDFDLPGFTSNPYSEMRTADLFLLTSRWEGLGIVLVEALALGTPVVATDCPSGPREVLDHGRYGPLVPVGDYQRLALEMEKTLDRPPPSALLRQGAAPYTLERSVTAYLAAMGLENTR